MSPLTRSGLLAGIGFGALSETVVFGLFLGAHHVVCPDETCRSPQPEQLSGMLASDAFLLVGAGGLLFLAMFSLFEAARRSGSVWSYKVLFGSLLAGFGAYMAGEGLLCHTLLKVHHVVWGQATGVWDGVYLGIGGLLLLIGLVVLEKGRAERDQSYSIPEVKRRWYLG